jgi:serine/threonine-protein kinase
MDVPVREGDLIGDAYRVERVIGSGGMAVVVAAIDLRGPERVAIKLLTRKAARSAQVLKRFEREQRLVQQLRNEHVTRALGSGVHKGAPYMVMEYLQGSDLAQVLKTQGAVPVETAVDYVLQACEAVAEAHALGIVHRDLKPGNLFLARRADGSPCIKILDFGVAKAGEQLRVPGEDTLTKTTAVFGSPFYMSPEQMISAKEVGPATDVWALGVILYELLGNRIPFAARTPEKVCARVLHDDPTPLREVCPEAPPGLEAAVLRCLQRRPAGRFADVADLAEALAAWAPERTRDSATRAAAYLHKTDAAPKAQAPIDMAPVPARDPAEPPEVPTVYMGKGRRGSLASRQIVGLVAFGLATFGLGFLAGHWMRGVRALGSPAPSAASAPAAAAACASSIVAALPPVGPSSAPAASEELAAAETPIEVDLDEEAARKARVAPQRKKKPEAPSESDEVDRLSAAYHAALAAVSASASPAASGRRDSGTGAAAAGTTNGATTGAQSATASGTSAAPAGSKAATTAPRATASSPRASSSTAP